MLTSTVSRDTTRPIDLPIRDHGHDRSIQGVGQGPPNANAGRCWASPQLIHRLMASTAHCTVHLLPDIHFFSARQ